MTYWHEELKRQGELNRELSKINFLKGNKIKYNSRINIVRK